MKPALIAAVAALGIAAATAFAMSTKAWADSPWWTSEDEMDEVVFGRIEFGPRSRYAVPNLTLDYIREQYKNPHANYITPHRSLIDQAFDEKAFRKKAPK